MWFEDISFNWKLDRLHNKKEAIWGIHQPELDRARDEGNLDEEQSIASVAFHEIDMVKSEISSLQHDYITKLADRLLIPIPPFSTKSGDWIQSEFDGAWSLTPKLLDEFGRDVRRERRERIELVFLWPSSLIGLIGGLIGISSIFFR